MAIVLKAVAFGYQIEGTVLVVPVATLFAFTSLRTSLPGAPAAFGACLLTPMTENFITEVRFAVPGAIIGVVRHYFELYMISFPW